MDFHKKTTFKWTGVSNTKFSISQVIKDFVQWKITAICFSFEMISMLTRATIWANHPYAVIAAEEEEEEVKKLIKF